MQHLPGPGFRSGKSLALIPPHCEVTDPASGTELKGRMCVCMNTRHSAHIGSIYCQVCLPTSPSRVGGCDASVSLYLGGWSVPGTQLMPTKRTIVAISLDSPPSACSQVAPRVCRAWPLLSPPDLMGSCCVEPRAGLGFSVSSSALEGSCPSLPPSFRNLCGYHIEGSMVQGHLRV